jgi:hypothetical protein
VILADGGECASDLESVRDQEALFGPVTYDSTSSHRVTGSPLSGCLASSGPRAGARAVLEIFGASERLTIDSYATLTPTAPRRRAPLGTTAAATASTIVRRAPPFAPVSEP